MARRPVRRNGRHLKGNRTSLRRGIFSTIMSIFFIYFFIAVLTAFGPGSSLSFASINDASKHVPEEMFVYLMGMENRYFTQTLPEDHSPPSVSSTVFQLATSIDPDDPRSLLGRELPGFSSFDGQILVGGEGEGFMTMPIESAPPMEVLMAEREASTERLEEMEQIKEDMMNDPAEELIENVFHIIHSHNRESFLPELKDTDVAFHDSVNITLVGERLGLELEKRGIGGVVDTSDINSKLNDRGWQYSRSYDMSREVIKQDIETHGDFDFYFDLHRDSQPRDLTTVEIDGKKYARILFVIGKNNPNYEQNLRLAEELHERIKDNYPGITRAVYSPPLVAGRDGSYNQDLDTNSVLVEFGGVDNSLEEVYRTVEIFADAFSDYYFENNQ
ncbi:stage II sporulation protein P [Bacillus shivajii]|uniref:stage II sporulation protein P n=1 Tax=Bacillus shivajii TaxID=1983719 RepID=UPI001CFA2415|nr:stage II sporulation protein P [Bacillus shivajii]UCZ54480.1 stage II sporulation protein P [Bacillus shivajii]